MCTMCGCGESGNMGDMKSPDMPMMVKPDIFNSNDMMPTASNLNGIVVTQDVPNRTGMESIGENGAVRN